MQMFTAITKLVLKTKKEQQLRIQQQHTNETVKLRSSSHGGRRKKCCWHDLCSLFCCYFVCNNFICCLGIFILGMYQSPNPSAANPGSGHFWQVQLQSKFWPYILLECRHLSDLILWCILNGSRVISILLDHNVCVIVMLHQSWSGPMSSDAEKSENDCYANRQGHI